MPTLDDALERQVAQWRSRLQPQPAMRAADLEELESRLRCMIAELRAIGLDAEEAFLVAVKRMGKRDAASRELAHRHSERLWKQLAVTTAANADSGGSARRESIVVIALAVAAAAAIKLPLLFGYPHIGSGDGLVDDAGIYFPNLSFFVLPFLVAYFAWKRRLCRPVCIRLAVGFVAAALLINGLPFTAAGHTQLLASLHLPIALWLLVGIAYAGGCWRDAGRRMDFVRFSGELFIYYVLMALGGAVLTGFTSLTFAAIGTDAEWFAVQWMLPCGAMGAVIIGARLVEAKQNVIENMAPVLTRLFTPLFAAALLVLLITMAWTGSGIDLEREVLIGFDLLLAVVVGLLLYSVSARDPQEPPNAFDALQFVLVVCALLVDAVALTAIAGRIAEFGITPNRMAALGENLVLLVNLAWSAWLYARFLSRRGPVSALERWQTAYLPVYAAWAGCVVVVFPPLFGFI